MEKQTKQPWSIEPGSEREKLDILVSTLQEVHAFARTFAEENDITYGVESDKFTVEFTALNGDFEKFKAHVTALVGHANEVFKKYENEYEGDFTMKAVDAGDSIKISVE